MTMYYNITAIIIKTNLNAYSLTHILYLLMVHIIITDLRELEMLSMWYKIYVDFLTKSRIRFDHKLLRTV